MKEKVRTLREDQSVAENCIVDNTHALRCIQFLNKHEKMLL